jgi:hypothetical protein
MGIISVRDRGGYNVRLGHNVRLEICPNIKIPRIVII